MVTHLWILRAPQQTASLATTTTTTMLSAGTAPVGTQVVPLEEPSDGAAEACGLDPWPPPIIAVPPIPTTTTRMYMDDLTYRAIAWDAIQLADSVVQDFAAAWGISISPKTQTFSTSTAGHLSLRRLSYNPTEELKWLGTHHHLGRTDGVGAAAATTKKITTTRQRLRRIQWMQLPWALKEHFIATNAIAGLAWCPLGQCHDVKQLRAVDLQVFHTMFGGNAKALQKVAKEFFWTTLVRGHKISSLVVRTFSLYVALRHMTTNYQERLTALAQRSAQSGQKVHGGLLTTLQHMTTSIGLALTDDLALTGGDEAEPDLPLFAPLPPKDYLHRLRSLWRGAQFRLLQQRRPHYAGLAYRDIHTKLLRRWLK